MIGEESSQKPDVLHISCESRVGARVVRRSRVMSNTRRVHRSVRRPGDSAVLVGSSEKAVRELGMNYLKVYN